MNGRVEIITRPERRRRWSDEEKLQIVAEACRPGNSVSRVARERGVNASQLFGWRRQMLAKGLVTDNRSEASAGPALTFAPVEVKEETAAAFAEQEASSTRRRVASGMPAMIEVELKGGDCVRVEGCADAGLVVRIISALRGA